MRTLQTTLFFFLLTAATRLATAFTFHNPAAWSSSRHSLLSLFNSPTPKYPEDDESDDKWDADVDYEKEWVEENQQQSSVDPATSWDALPPQLSDDNDTLKLGIDIGKQLKPFSPKEAAELKAEAAQVINDAIDAGIDDIETLRMQMKKELESNRKVQQFAAERNAQLKSEELMTKIDKMTGDFLASTQTTRESTKTAALASQAMETSNQGIEMGTWGTLAGMTVIAGGLTESSSTLLGSVDNAKRQASIQDASSSSTTTEVQENRIIVIADSKQVRSVELLSITNSKPEDACLT
jgi:hypothetical protein